SRPVARLPPPGVTNTSGLVEWEADAAVLRRAEGMTSAPPALVPPLARPAPHRHRHRLRQTGAARGAMRSSQVPRPSPFLKRSQAASGFRSRASSAARKGEGGNIRAGGADDAAENGTWACMAEGLGGVTPFTPGPWRNAAEPTGRKPGSCNFRRCQDARPQQLAGQGQRLAGPPGT